MVALLGFLDLFEVCVELFLFGESRSVDAGEHRIFGITAPIGAGHFHQLESIPHFADRGHMRAAAEIEPVALLVDLDLLIGGDGVDQLDLEAFAHVAENFLRMLARPDFLRERFVARDDLAHLFFDDRKIFQRERLIAREVVIKSVFDHRPDGDLRSRPQILDRFGKHVRGVMPDQFEGARILAGNEFDFGVAVDRVGEIGERAVERHCDRALRQ